jgi:hypothetical protein
VNVHEFTFQAGFVAPEYRTQTEHAEGAPAGPGVPWGLAFETWDPRSKGPLSPAYEVRALPQ